MKTGACSDKNAQGKSAKDGLLLKMDLASIKMLRNETWKLEITSYYKKSSQKKKQQQQQQQQKTQIKQ